MPAVSALYEKVSEVAPSASIEAAAATTQEKHPAAKTRRASGKFVGTIDELSERVKEIRDENPGISYLKVAQMLGVRQPLGACGIQQYAGGRSALCRR
jgi:hypothetical protein